MATRAEDPVRNAGENKNFMDSANAVALRNLLPLPLGLGYLYMGRGCRFAFTVIVQLFLLFVLFVISWTMVCGQEGCPYNHDRSYIRALIFGTPDEPWNGIGGMATYAVWWVTGLFTALDAWRLFRADRRIIGDSPAKAFRLNLVPGGLGYLYINAPVRFALSYFGLLGVVACCSAITVVLLNIGHVKRIDDGIQVHELAGTILMWLAVPLYTFILARDAKRSSDRARVAGSETAPGVGPG